MKLSIIIPLFKDINIEEMYNKIVNNLKKMKYEIIFVTCKENEILDKLFEDDMVHVKVIYLSKEFNYDLLVQSGIDYSTGEYTIIIDDSFDIENINKMIKELDDDKKLDIISTGFNNNLKCDSFGYRMIKNNVKDAIKEIGYSNKVYSIIGFNTKYMEIDNKEVSYSVIKELNKMSLIGFSISIGFIIISIIYLIVSLILGHFSILLFVLLLNISFEFIIMGIHFLDKNKKENYIVKKKIGFDKSIL